MSLLHQKHNKKRTVIITGSNRGLGQALAIAFARAGNDIIIHGRNQQDLQRVSKNISEMGVDCFSVAGDLCQSETMNALLQAARSKNATVLINNAAQKCPYQLLDDLADETIDVIIETNLLAPIKLTRRIYSLFSKCGGGAIININSLSGLYGQEKRTIYCASKWGLRGFTQALEIEAVHNNIEIMSVFISRTKTRSEFTYGMEPQAVAQKIYDAYANSNKRELIIDGRPKKEKE